MSHFLHNLLAHLSFGHKSQQEEYVCEVKEMRTKLSEQEIDKTLKDSFPASDPPAWY